MGTAVIRLADADILPFEFTNLAETVAGYVKDLQDAPEAAGRTRWASAIARSRTGCSRRSNDPRRPRVIPAVEPVPPALNFAPLENASRSLVAAAERYKKALAAAGPRLRENAAVVKAVNERLRQSERQLLDPAGLAGREWYRHLIYAPGFYTGYDVKTLPGVREAIEQSQYKDVEPEVARAARALEREAALIEAAAADLERVGAAPRRP